MIDIIEMPSKLKRKIVFTDNQKKSNKIAKKLEDRNILLYLNFNLRMDGVKDNRNHVFYLSDVLVHKGIPQEIMKSLQMQFIEFNRPITKISFLERENIKDIDEYNNVLGGGYVSIF